jgi:hypothetical protein
MFAILTLFLSTQIWALSGTKGTPIGGMGTGYVKFNALTGNFAASGKVPPAASDGESEFSKRKSGSSGFHFYAGGKTTKKARATTDNEDAKCPVYTADFGKTGDVDFSLTAFGPFIPGDNELNFQLATSPLAFFEITAKNTGHVAVDVAAAMEFSNTNALDRNLLGGADHGEVDSSSNNKAISYPGYGNAGNAYLIVDCNNSAATYSAGSIGNFFTDGKLSNENGDLVSAKCNIPAGDSVKFKFTLAWWRTFVSKVDRYNNGKVDEENYYYHNFYKDSKSAALFGVSHFDNVCTAMKSMVSRVMGSNFPEWYKDRLLNNTYPLIHNTQCAKDGRMAFWEGHYPIIGTIDQAEHAALFYIANWPKHQWNELKYWLSTSHTGVGEPAELKGQIHHDFNSAPKNWEDASHFMAPWDNYSRQDYWWCPDNTKKWSDLNSMAIFKAYELMLATGNLDSMKVYFPQVLKTGDRLLRMSSPRPGEHLPIECMSTYDQSAELTPQYASGVALTSFLAMEDMAKFVGDTITARKYRDWYNIAKIEFTYQNNTDFCTSRDFAEGDVAGYSWAHYLCLEPIMDSAFINGSCKRLSSLYTSKSALRDKLGQWHFYTYDHWGGAEIARGNPDEAMMIHKWDYDYYYTESPAYTFWQDLQKTNSAYASYMTGPTVWRSYYQMTGYLLDNAHKRLWIRPQVPSEMDSTITNAALPNPYGWGTLNYNGKIKGDLTQLIKVSFDSTIAIKEIVLNNNTGSSSPVVKITQNGADLGFTSTLDTFALEKNIHVMLNETLNLGSSGIEIKVYKQSGGLGKFGFVNDVVQKTAVLSFPGNRISAGHPISYSIDVDGGVSMELLSLNGKKIGTIFSSRSMTAGKHSFVWNGQTVDGNRINSSILILRLTSSCGTISKKVLTGF